jgi:glycosyltransferase involved in cell wall biosynthesis
MKKKLLIISPHFSTGGSCQFTVNKVELLKDNFDIKVIEYNCLSLEFVVQRNKMIELMGSDFYSLGNNKRAEIEDIISTFKPDIVSLEEFPEMFMSNEVAWFLYHNKNRNYKIFETTHDSSFDTHNKKMIPDAFVFVSQYSALKYAQFNIPIHVVEYPVNFSLKNCVEYKEKLGWSNKYIHVVIVGLFTARKNQAYAFEIAEKLQHHNILFHFVGNQAENFASYWKPLMDKKPHNCIIHGERDNVEDYLRAADLFLFPSKGDRNNKELNPLVIKEAQKYKHLPKLIFNLDVYLNKYDNQDNFHYLTGNLITDVCKIITITNSEKIVDNLDKEAIIIGTYPNLLKREQLTIECIRSLKPLNRKIILVSHFPVSAEIQNMVDYYIFDKENPLTHHSYYTKFYNTTPEYHAEININGLKDTNQSYTVYTNLVNGMNFAKQLGFEYAFYITYDVIVHKDDLKEITSSFRSVSGGYNAYLATLNTPFGKGIQTTAMTFNTSFFCEEFVKMEDESVYNHTCIKLKSENFLEDYLMKVVNTWNPATYNLITNVKETFLTKSGLGVSSNSEYYSILPIKGEENKFMFYFYTYNVDDRRVGVHLNGGNKSYHEMFTLSQTKEFKHEFEYNGLGFTLVLCFYDGENKYKEEKFEINSDTIHKYQQTGYFEWKKNKPKIKLVHLQTTINDEREQKSREQLEKVQIHNWEYIHYANVPFEKLPPKQNCQRPDCVSLCLFDEATINEKGTALTPHHFGCYKAFYDAIMEQSNNTDFLIICEGDCKIEIPLEDFISKVEQVCTTVKNTDIGYISFGDKATLEHGWLQSPKIEDIPNQDLIYITNHIIGLQCIMFPKNVFKWLKDKFSNQNWDAADIFLNSIFVNSSHKMAIVDKRLTTQYDGYSLIDQTEKKFL